MFFPYGARRIPAQGELASPIYVFLQGSFGNCGFYLRQGQLQRLDTLVALAVNSEGNAGGFLFFFAKHEHRVDFVHFGISDFAADFVA